MMQQCAFNVSVANALWVEELADNKAHLTIPYRQETFTRVMEMNSPVHYTYLSIRKPLFTDEIFEQCLTNGIRVEVWQVSSQKELDTLKAKGCDYILTEQFMPNL